MACSSEHPCQRGTQKAGEKDPSLLPPSHGGLPAPPTLVKDSGLLTPLGCLLGLQRLHCHLCCMASVAQRKKSRWEGKSSKENVGSSVIRVPRRHFRCPDLGKTKPLSLVSLRMPRCLRVPLTSVSPHPTPRLLHQSFAVFPTAGSHSCSPSAPPSASASPPPAPRHPPSLSKPSYHSLSWGDLKTRC